MNTQYLRCIHLKKSMKILPNQRLTSPKDAFYLVQISRHNQVNILNALVEPK